MAIYHCKVGIISRSTGRSSVGAAAYRAGECLTNERDGITHDYTRKGGVTHSEIMTPDNAPEWAKDREKLWNEVEKAEKSVDAQLCREVEVALPAELTPEQQRELVRDYVKENFVDHGMIADVAIHDKGDGNPHAHVLLTMREVDREGNWQQKCKKKYELDKDGNKQRLPSGNYKCRKVETNDWNKKESLERWRSGWEKTANRHLERAGHETRIDHRSLEAQGIDREPQIHEGRARVIQKKEAKRGKTVELDRSRINREIKERNAELKKQIAAIKKVEKQQARYLKNVERILKKAERIKDVSEVRTEAGAEKVQEKNQQTKLNLGAVAKICLRESEQGKREIEKIRAEIAALRQDILPPENVHQAAINKHLGKEILADLKQQEKKVASLDAGHKQYERDIAQQTADVKSVRFLDFKRKAEIDQRAAELARRGHELERQKQELGLRAQEINGRIRERMAEPGSKQHIQAIEHKINEGSREADKKVSLLENKLKMWEDKVQKWDKLHQQIEPEIRRIGNAEIVIKGPMTRENIYAQGRSQLAELLRNHPAPQRVRGRTQARIADDDDPTKRGKGLDI